MPVEYLDHAADVGLRATGATLEEAFCEAARGLFGLMVDLAAVVPRETYDVQVEAPTWTGLLVEWLSDLLAQVELTGLVFSAFHARIVRKEGGFRLDGAASGEPLDSERHRAGIEVKGISYLGLDVGRRDGGWAVRCVVDV